MRTMNGYEQDCENKEEALHMTDEEHDILVSLMRQIKDELQKKPGC